MQHIVGKVYEKSRQNITIIFDIPHNAEDADVTRVYEDLKGMVYDDAHRRPVLGIIILSNHYQVDAFPRDKGRFETLWVGDLEESEATEYVGKLQADGSVLTDMGTGLKELAWANRLPRWKEEVEYSVRAARGQDRHARKLMAMICGRGCCRPQHDPPLDFRGQSVLSFGGCVPHRQALQRGLLLRQEAATPSCS